jgi:hypothetical protein
MVGWKDWNGWAVEEGPQVGTSTGPCIKSLNSSSSRKASDGETVLAEWDDVGQSAKWKMAMKHADENQQRKRIKM